MARSDDDEQDQQEQEDDFHPKNEEGTQNEPPKKKITLQVQHQENTIMVAVSMNTQFSKVFDAACQKFNKKKGTMRFLFDGRRIEKTETPKMLEMEDQDLIHAEIEQLGGCC